MTPEEGSQKRGCPEASLFVPCALTDQGDGGCFATENIGSKNGGLCTYSERSFIFLYLRVVGRGSQRLILPQTSPLLLDGNILVVPNWPTHAPSQSLSLLLFLTRKLFLATSHSTQ